MNIKNATSEVKSYEVTIIIVSYNTKYELEECIDRLLGLLGYIEIIVVDNLSSDNSLQMLHTNYDKFPEIKIIENGYNAGFTAACNLASSKASGKNLLFLNSDSLCDQESVKKMSSYLSNNQEVAVVGPGLKYDNEKTQLSHFFKSDLLNLFNIIIWHILSSQIAEPFLVYLTELFKNK